MGTRSVAKFPRIFLGIAGAISLTGAFAAGWISGHREPPPPTATRIIPEPTGAIATPGTAFTFCLPCHRPDGQGIPGVFPSLVRSARLLGDPRLAVAIVLHGFDSHDEPTGPRWSGRMPGLAHLPDADLAAALTYARSAWGNQAEPVTPATVSALRALTSNRTTPWTSATLAITVLPIVTPPPAQDAPCPSSR